MPSPLLNPALLRICSLGAISPVRRQRCQLMSGLKRTVFRNGAVDQAVGDTSLPGSVKRERPPVVVVCERVPHIVFRPAEEFLEASEDGRH